VTYVGRTSGCGSTGCGSTGCCSTGGGATGYGATRRCCGAARRETIIISVLSGFGSGCTDGSAVFLRRARRRKMSRPMARAPTTATATAMMPIMLLPPAASIGGGEKGGVGRTICTVCTVVVGVETTVTPGRKLVAAAAEVSVEPIVDTNSAAVSAVGVTAHVRSPEPHTGQSSAREGGRDR